MFFVGKAENFFDFTGQGGTDLFQYITIIPLDFVLIIVIDNLVLYAGTLSKLVTANVVFRKCDV